MNVIRWATLTTLILMGAIETSAQQQAAVMPVPAVRSLSAVQPDAVGTIQGNALNSTNGQMANTTVRLRDARFGRILDSQLTDQSGLFTFKALDPGSYIVEMMANDRTVLAASQIVNINAGEAVSAVVKLPFRIPPFAGVLGNTTPTTAAALATEAAASSVLAITPVGEPTCP